MLAAELIQFAAFVRTQKPVTVNESAELTMYKLLSSPNLSQTFPNVEIALRIYLCMMVSNASGPASGASQSWGESKGICDLQWGRKGPSRMLTLMSIEHELLRSLDFTDTIEEFVLRLRLAKQQ